MSAEPTSGEVALADLLGDDGPIFAADETHTTWSNRGPTQPLTREAFEAAVQAMRAWKRPESWTEPCPACSARGYRRTCEMCRGMGVVCGIRQPVGLSAEAEGWFLATALEGGDGES